MGFSSKYILLLLSLVVLSTACDKQGKSTTGNKFSNIDVSKVMSQNLTDLKAEDLKNSFQMEIKVSGNNQNEVLMSDVIDSVWYVKLGDIPDDLMSDFISGIEFHDDRIYLSDGQKYEVYVFDIGGKFLYSKKAEGEGPGEFTRAAAMSVDPFHNRLVIHDDRLSKVLYYTLEGAFLREQRVAYRFLNFAYVNDSLMAVDLNKTDNYHLKAISNNQLALVDSTWKILATGAGYNAAEERQLFISGEVFSRKGEKLFYLQPFSYAVYMFEENILTPYCLLDFGEQSLPEDTNFKFSSASDFGYEYADYSYMLDNGQFLKDVTYFEHFYGGGKRAHLFRSNLTGKLFHGNVVNDIYSLGFFHISTSIPEQNVLVSYISSEEIYAKKNYILESNTGNKALRNMMADTQSTDNPVLIFYRLRKDY